MKYLIIILILLIAVPQNVIATKNIWEQKRERYEKAKRESEQRGEVWNPSKFQQIEDERLGENSMSLVTILLVLGGIVLAVFIVVSVVESISKSPERKFWVVLGLALIAFMLLLTLIGRGNKSSGNYYDRSEEYLENSKMHTDRHY